MEKEYVYIPKEIANKIKGVEDVTTIENAIKEYAAQNKKELESYIEGMGEDMLYFRAMMIKARDSFKKAKEEELNAYYSLWEKFDEDRVEIRKKVTAIKEELNPLIQEITELKKLCQSVDTWGISNLVESVSKFKNLYGTEKEMFEFLVNNFKRNNGNT